VVSARKGKAASVSDNLPQPSAHEMTRAPWRFLGENLPLETLSRGTQTGNAFDRRDSSPHTPRALSTSRVSKRERSRENILLLYLPIQERRKRPSLEKTLSATSGSDLRPLSHPGNDPKPPD
jgi:hypothetical protein